MASQLHSLIPNQPMKHSTIYHSSKTSPNITNLSHKVSNTSNPKRLPKLKAEFSWPIHLIPSPIYLMIKSSRMLYSGKPKKHKMLISGSTLLNLKKKKLKVFLEMGKERKSILGILDRLMKERIELEYLYGMSLENKFITSNWVMISYLLVLDLQTLMATKSYFMPTKEDNLDSD